MTNVPTNDGKAHLACPFCSQQESQVIHDEEKTLYWRQCILCGARGPTAADPARANGEWGRRAIKSVRDVR